MNSYPLRKKIIDADRKFILKMKFPKYKSFKPEDLFLKF